MSQKPKGVSQEPKSTSHKPKGASQKPKGASQKPKGASQKPKGAAKARNRSRTAKVSAGELIKEGVRQELISEGVRRELTNKGEVSGLSLNCPGKWGHATLFIVSVIRLSLRHCICQNTNGHCIRVASRMSQERVATSPRLKQNEITSIKTMGCLLWAQNEQHNL